MNDEQLKWEITDSKELLHTPVFDVLEQHEVSATGVEGDYIAMEAPDWVQVIAEHKGNFLLVRQWRHASDCMSVEFPGGVADDGETPMEAARRELLEETGFEAGEIVHLGTTYPNPALFKNRYHVFLARDLTKAGEQKLDDDEFLNYLTVPINEVIDGYGSGEYTHALMGTALAFYLRRKMNE